MSILGTLEDEIYQLKMKVANLKYENRIYKKAAIEWMKEFDRLKNEYEPEILVENQEF